MFLVHRRQWLVLPDFLSRCWVWSQFSWLRIGSGRSILSSSARPSASSCWFILRRHSTDCLIASGLDASGGSSQSLGNPVCAARKQPSNGCDLHCHCTASLREFSLCWGCAGVTFCESSDLPRLGAARPHNLKNIMWLGYLVGH